MIGIKYIGSRETHTDNLYGTGLVWAGGQVHNVENGVAAKMLAHTDVYKEAKTTKDEPETVAVKEDVEEKLPVPLPNLEGMDKNELIVFAKQHYGEHLHHKMSESNMRDRVLSFIQARGR